MSCPAAAATNQIHHQRVCRPSKGLPPQQGEWPTYGNVFQLQQLLKLFLAAVKGMHHTTGEALAAAGWCLFGKAALESAELHGLADAVRGDLQKIVWSQECWMLLKQRDSHEVHHSRGVRRGDGS